MLLCDPLRALQLINLLLWVTWETFDLLLKPIVFFLGRFCFCHLLDFFGGATRLRQVVEVIPGQTIATVSSFDQAMLTIK